MPATPSNVQLNPHHKSSTQQEETTGYEQLATSQMNAEGVYTTPDVTASSNRKYEKQKERAHHMKIIYVLATPVIASLLVTTTCIICIAVLFTEIATLKSNMKLLFEQHTITSCADLPPSAPSGYYLIRNSSLHVYCDMSRTCGGVTGGWMRVFELDMNITSHQCPNGLSQRTDGGLRTCVRNVSAAGCSSIFLPTRNVNYSRVCGRITGYQIGTTDDFLLQQSSDINSIYVDGVSLTHGLSPRQHIWTFAAALRRSHCPCQLGHVPPSFVGNDYFCDSGTQEHASPATFYSDPLWNDADCVCCANPPWFHQQLPQPTSDDIEMRVCRSDSNIHEDAAIQVVEIYVR